MITVNNTPFENDGSLTIKELLEKKRYMDHMIVVKVNGLHVRPEDYKTKVVHDGDDVKVIHLFGGG
ncbi:sulfur carrier protein ThiS [Acidaminobacter sp. JC074]|uniref:sulfur carrier protein ThiS n=1 Tax=Acidaminobacter sp. JC074 TaxID=2530199 RepID=UPI001F0D6B1B|nr:sulfur carrier protein ThiS [Acidaminobacter sp. JC074]MCH4889907.1 sulfur carrier protein ThiS [Acidaminobacter sp. JC074]